MPLCASCGAENSPGRKFCGRCGTPLARTCPTCGAANEADVSFCGECGTRLDGEQPAAAPVRESPAAERRLVSVLFADLVGFTSLSESRDAEEVRELLSRYFDSCRRLIGLYGGTVEKFIGDAVMAVWGTPTATEDDAERAVRAALDLVAAVSALGDEIGAPELRARAGVLTGEAAVTIGAEGQGMVAGDLVNTASRVQSAAEPGAVFVGEATRRTTEQAIVYEEAGSFELKGKEGLTPLWRALRVVSGARGSLKSQGLEAPFVGRDRELRQLKDLFHACADERKAHLVSITGIGGIGKSRLGWEFYKYIDGLAQTSYWHRGRCLAYGEGVAYWALADMVRFRCRIAEDEQPDAALAKLRTTLEEIVLDAEERRYVEPRLAHLLGLGEHEVRDRQDLFAAWRLFFERLAENYPTVLAFEDLQWADEGLLDFVEYLLDWSRSHPLYVITAARPELMERRPTWGAGQRNFTSIYLEPLSGAAMGELLAGLVPGLPESLREQILARAEGVPLYAVETVRMLLDRGALVQEGAVYRPVGEIDELEVPETLHALIAARLDGLSEAERRLLQDGAVVGKTFTRDAVAALSGLSAGEAEPLLASLVRKEVLGLQADPRSPEHGQYGFLQDLVRRVAYETLSRKERRARHLAAAAHLEAVFPDEEEIAEVLASHYLDAYESAPEADDAPELKERARRSLVRAGERAESLAAAAEARRYFEQAAGLSDEPAERAELLDRAGFMASYAADPEAAMALLGEALEIYESAGNAHAGARLAHRLAQVETDVGRYDDAIARMERALEVIGTDEPDEEVASLAARLAGAYFFTGDLDRARERIELALDAAESLGAPEPLARALGIKALIATARGHPHEATAYRRESLAVALEHDLLDLAGGQYANLSDQAFRRDRYGEALDYLREGLELARKVGHRPGEWSILAEMTYPLYMTGRWDEALTTLEEPTEEQFGSGALLLSLLTSVLEIHIHRGDLDRARRLYAQFERVASSVDVQEEAIYAGATAALRRAEGRLPEALDAGAEAVRVGVYGMSYDHQAVKQGLVEAVEAALVLGERARAEELLAGADAIPPGLRSPYLDAQARRLRARLAGDEAGLAAAAARFRELEVPFWLAVALLEHAELTGDEDSLAEAQEIFEQLGAAPWLQRLDGARREAEVAG
jgi:class 3 adenylate cyclase/tetratricopeptide (TPR) repeat protein